MSSKSIYTSPLCSCIICHKEYSAKGIHSHYLGLHGTIEERQRQTKGAHLGLQTLNKNRQNAAIIETEKLMLAYQILPKICINCNLSIPFNKRNNKFCSRTCAASFTNRAREPMIDSIKHKISESVKLNHKKSKRIYERKIVGPYCRITGFEICTCCSKEFLSNGRKTCSPECQRQNSTYRKIVHLFEHQGKILKLESSWEVDIANWLNEHKIEWIRPNHIEWIDSTGKLRRYFPDFYLIDFNIYLDPKNDYQISISEEKLNIISKSYTLIYGKTDFIKSKILEIIT